MVLERQPSFSSALGSAKPVIVETCAGKKACQDFKEQIREQYNPHVDLIRLEGLRAAGQGVVRTIQKVVYPRLPAYTRLPA